MPSSGPGDRTRSAGAPGAGSWRTGDVWAISLSAFFADLGYQAVLAGFPLFLVISLHQPVYELGLATALSYGGGALVAYLGGRLGTRIGHRRLALVGNALIPLLSLSAIVANPAISIGLLTGGWWARNLRTPSRRTMLVEAVPKDSDRSRAFGFLHALDVGGGALAGVYVLAALSEGVALRWIFLATAIPLVISTASLFRARVGTRAASATAPGEPPVPRAGGPEGSATPAGPIPEPAHDSHAGSGEQRQAPSDERQHGRQVDRTVRRLLVAAGLYGFTSYSVAFPVLTVAVSTGRPTWGIGAFLLLQAVSAATGYLFGGRLGAGASGQLARLGLVGYLPAAVGAALLALGAGAHLGLPALLPGVAVIGFALGIIETLEPSAISMLRLGNEAGRGFGALSAARGIGTLAGNLAMGLLYEVAAAAAYGYAAFGALAAAGVVVSGALVLAREAGPSST